jgi:hypothetical protein
LVEAYVQRRLAEDDIAAFEQHYFSCDQCFADVQEMEKFIAGVRQAGRQGLLDGETTTGRWALPAFAFASFAALIFAVGLSYQVFIRMPEREQALRKELSAAQNNASRAGQLEQLAALDKVPAINLPVVILTAERAPDSRRQVKIDATTREAVFWIDVPPAPPGAKFNLTITAPGGRFSKTIQGLDRNQDGALAFSLPVSDLENGSYVVRLFQPSGRMLSEYRVDVERK